MQTLHIPFIFTISYIYIGAINFFICDRILEDSFRNVMNFQLCNFSRSLFQFL